MIWTSPLWRRLRGRHARPLAFLVETGFVAVDLETTSLDPRQAAVVALAAIPFVGERPESGYVTLVRPGVPIPPASTAVHGITDAMVAEAPEVDEVMPVLERVCEHQVLVGHRLDYDLTVLARVRRLARRPPLRNVAVDTMSLAAALYPKWRGWTLDETAERLGVTIEGRHSARGDAEAAGRLLLAMLPAARAKGCHTLAELLWLQDVGATRLARL